MRLPNFKGNWGEEYISTQGVVEKFRYGDLVIKWDSKDLERHFRSGS